MIRDAVLDLCHAIEELPASEQQTKLCGLANALHTKIAYSELSQVAGAKGWFSPESAVPNLDEKRAWVFYWNLCRAYEKEPMMETPVPPCL